MPVGRFAERMLPAPLAGTLVIWLSKLPPRGTVFSTIVCRTMLSAY